MIPLHPKIQAGPRGPAFFYPLAAAPLLILLLLLVLAGGKLASASEPLLRADGRVDFIRPDGSVAASVAVEIADTPESREKGLMGRGRLDSSEGMLFVWEEAKGRRFWMRDTPISLDMIFVDADGRILNVIGRTQPMSDRTYSSRGPAQYVVEVKGGFADRFGIDESCRIEWRRLGKADREP